MKMDYQKAFEEQVSFLVGLDEILGEKCREYTDSTFASLDSKVAIHTFCIDASNNIRDALNKVMMLADIIRLPIPEAKRIEWDHISRGTKEIFDSVYEELKAQLEERKEKEAQLDLMEGEDKFDWSQVFNQN